MLHQQARQHINYAILVAMIGERHIWRTWAQTLQNWGLKDFTAWLLDATKPVHVLGAQMVYVGQPLLSMFFSKEHIQTFADVLEQPDETSAFVHFLLEEASS